MPRRPKDKWTAAQMIFMLFIAALPMSYLAAMGGFAAALFQTARSAISTNSDTKCKSPTTLQIPPNYKRSLSCCFAPFPAPCLITECGASRASNQPRQAHAPRGPWGRKKKNLIQNTAKNKLKRGLLDRNYRPSSRPPRQHSRAAVISDRKGY